MMSGFLFYLKLINICYICLQQYCYVMDKNKEVEQLKAQAAKEKDPKIKQIIEKKIEQVTKPFNK